MEKQYRLRRNKDNTSFWLMLALTFMLVSSMASLFKGPISPMEVTDADLPFVKIAEVAAVVG